MVSIESMFFILQHGYLTCLVCFAGEVEEQIEHLEKQVPDWICRRVTHSGDVLYK